MASRAVWKETHDTRSSSTKSGGIVIQSRQALSVQDFRKSDRVSCGCKCGCCWRRECCVGGWEVFHHAKAMCAIGERAEGRHMASHAVWMEEFLFQSTEMLLVSAA